MGTSILTNLNSLHAQESFRVNSDFQAGVIERLTSGFRISHSGDDPAGLAIANRFRTDAGELTQGIRNLNDGISRLQIIDGGVDNISKILDRLKVLASQSLSETFSGDRRTLDSEFQTLLSEIDRQAQSIGLNSGGQFAQLLSVFVGGGTGAAGVTVNIDLRASMVDSGGLGLGGANAMQAVAGLADIGRGSLNHTVAQIIADGSNTTATPGYTEFYVSGPGFSDSNRIRISVNLQGVNNLDGLAAAINGGIQLAATGTSAAGTNFRNAGLQASASNGWCLAFTSPLTPFQVEAGDVLANALMGNLASPTGTSGAPLAATVQGVATAAAGDPFAPTGVTVRVAGAGLAAPVDIVLNSASVNTALAISDLATQVNGNGLLNASGISVSGAPGGPLTFTSARGEIFSVQATGDTANALGLGSFVTGAGGAMDYTAVTGAYDNTLSTGIAHLEFSLNGAPSIAIPDIDLAGGDAVLPDSRSGADLQKTLNDAFAADPALQAAGLVATFNGVTLTIASNNNTSFRLNAGGSDPTADIGFGTGGVSFTASLSPVQATSHAIQSSAATTVSPLSFTGLSLGSDGQTITISATDSAGILQTSILTLHNNDTGRAGRSIDEAIGALNNQLQQSSSAILRQIVAVKENVGGQERIGFLSSLRSFNVTVGNSVGGSGMNGGVAISEDSYPIGSLIASSVATRDFAILALNAISGAVDALGATQAIVGKAENQLSYAIDLSQSQSTNFASAESRIRDTDVAADAANLAKSQIMVQASVSTMAQANAAAEAVLALLRG